jgi:hypothetical protein
MTKMISEHSGYIYNLTIFNIQQKKSLANSENLHAVACNLSGALDFTPHVTIKFALFDGWEPCSHSQCPAALLPQTASPCWSLVLMARSPG